MKEPSFQKKKGFPPHRKVRWESPLFSKQHRNNNVGDTIMSQRISLRTELRTEDLLLMIKWMSNEHVYRYLN